MTAIFAHRGFTRTDGSADPAGDGAGRLRENTVEAFLAARLAGADGVELDVRLTADAELAVHHDRQVPGAGNITNIRALELPPHVPLLGAALAACAPLAVNVEVKHDPGTDPDRRAAAEVADVLASRATAGQPVLVSSFDPESLRVVRRRAGGIPTGLLIDWSTEPLAALDGAAALGCRTLHPFVTQVSGSLADAARKAGMGLHVWTVNAQDDLRAMAALGVEAVITDQVTAAVRILRGIS